MGQMPILRMREIRDLPFEDQYEKIVELKTELVRLRTMVKAGGSIENPARIREIRKHIARILTVMNESKSIRG